MKDSNLSRWLYQNRCFLTKDSKLGNTHLCLDGGRLNIPNHLIIDFYREYAKGLLSGEKYYICETTTPVIKMYCDFDYIGDEQISDQQLENWSKVCRNVILNSFGSHYDFVICCSESKTVQKNKRKQIKSGVHFIWKELFVSVDTARRVALAMINEFTDEFTNIGWNDIIDTGVYSNGLRMVGSRKVTNKKRKVKSSSTKSDESAAPATQKNDYEIIKVDEGREYIPYMYATHSELIKPEEDQLCYYNLKQLKQIMVDTCIRTFNNEAEIEPSGELPDSPESKKKKSYSNKIDTDVEDPKIFDRVEAFIRYQTITQWNSPLKQLRKHGKFYIAKIVSMYCLNVQREHNSCGIYFQITEHGMYQRCFCRCDTKQDRLDGPCSQYKSAPFILPREVVKMLFPNANLKKTSKANQNKINPGKEVFASNMLMKKRDTLPLYLNMSLNTIYLIEKKCL